MGNSSENQVKVAGLGHRGGGPRRFAPGAKPKNARVVIARVLRLYFRHGSALAAVGLLTVASALLSVSLPWLLGKAINTFAQPMPEGGRLLLTLLAALVGLHALNWLISTLSGVVMLKVSQRLVFTLREEFFAKLQHLPLAFFDSRSHGDTMSRLTNDVDNISGTIAQAASQTLSAVLLLSGSLVIMLSLSLTLTLAVLLCVPLVFLLTRIIARRSREYFLEQQRCLGAMGGLAEESILGLKMIKAFQLSDEMGRRFHEINLRLYESSRRAQTWAGFMMPLMNVINNLAFTVVAVVGGWLSVTSGLPVGTVVSFLSYAKQFTQPLSSLAGMFNTIQSGLAGAERVFEILDQAEESPDAPDAVDLPTPVGHVRFDAVSFAYEPGRPVLDQISFEARPGQSIALVGETGAGKTTVVNLLTRFYDAASGRILIDGHDIRSIKRSALRRCFSIVLQDTCLFSGSIMDNIRYARPGASDDDVLAAARLAHAHEFIEKLPQGYQTQVSGSAANLSEGQRQLLSIARAALSPSPILILDEATSSVDTRTEKNIQNAMRQLAHNRTCFLIAHRLSTIRDADLILVIGKGTLLESGSHEVLMAAHGHYYAMVRSQTEGGSERRSSTPRSPSCAAGKA